MTFLPVAVRELRVATRKRNTFWVRTLAGCVGLLIAGAILMVSLASGAPTVQMGGVLFSVLTWMALLGVLAAGLFFSSDCLSEEKREGTIGFLFLTDLRGYDVVSGKLLATSLRTFYALLALFPILGVTLLMGGVTGVQFFKVSLALLNALICSLAAGVFVSAISRDAQRAVGGTLLLLLLYVGAGPSLDALMEMKNNRMSNWFSSTSPAYAFVLAGQWGQKSFWPALLTSHLLAWILFAGACVLVPLTWQQKAARSLRLRSERFYSWKYGPAGSRAHLRRKLLAVDPILWLGCRERWQAVGMWLLALVILGGLIAMLILVPRQYWLGWGYINGLLSFVLYLGAATQACRFFVDARKAGLLELLLAAPLGGRQIMMGQARALLRMFGWPLLIILVTQMVAGWASHDSWKNLSARAGAVGPNWWFSVLGGFLGTLTTLANLAAICFFGMWMGVISKNANQATLKTLLFVQIIPWMVIMFASYMAAMLVILPRIIKGGIPTGAPQGMWLFPIIIAILSALLSWAKDVGFFFWAFGRLSTSLREQAARAIGPAIVPSTVAAVVPPPILPAPSKP
jgi:hypothetical protein